MYRAKVPKGMFGLQMTVDLQGRVTLPSQFREAYGIKPKDEVAVVCVDNGILIQSLDTCYNEAQEREREFNNRMNAD